MTETPTQPTAARSGRIASLLIGAGIFSSRIVGLVRERVVATYFGAGPYADVFSAGLRMPNVLQNLLGEGTLSASFIPAYSELLGQGRTAEAGRVAGAMFAFLLAVAAAIALLGVVLAPLLVSVFTPGFEGERRQLMITLVRILFPMTGVLVLSAWALGILNSHRQFFIPYFAPVLWNVAIIAALVGFGTRLESGGLLIAAGWGALLGGLLQFGIQLPWVLRLDREIRLNTGRNEPAFKRAIANAGPAILGRGVVQLSGYVDLLLASLLAVGAVSRLRYAQTLYVLPISLFAMSVAAAELPALSQERSTALEALRARASAAARRAAFYVVPSCVAFVLLGDVFVAAIYRAGEFTAADVTLVWLILIAYSLGLVASTSTRIYQSAFFALRDTKSPARAATLRVLTAAAVGAIVMLQLEAVRVFGITLDFGVLRGARVQGLQLGAMGLALGASVGAWLEWWLLHRRLASTIGTVGAGAGQLAAMFGAAVLAGGAGYGVKLLLEPLQPVLAAAVIAAVFGLVYLIAARLFEVSEAQVFSDSLLRRLRRKR
jgi:putative peptidoglycan lipid II flippase